MIYLIFTSCTHLQIRYFTLIVIMLQSVPHIFSCTPIMKPGLTHGEFVELVKSPAPVPLGQNKYVKLQLKWNKVRTKALYTSIQHQHCQVFKNIVYSRSSRQILNGNTFQVRSCSLACELRKYPTFSLGQ